MLGAAGFLSWGHGAMACSAVLGSPQALGGFETLLQSQELQKGTCGVTQGQKCTLHGPDDLNSDAM